MPQSPNELGGTVKGEVKHGTQIFLYGEGDATERLLHETFHLAAFDIGTAIWNFPGIRVSEIAKALGISYSVDPKEWGIGPQAEEHAASAAWDAALKEACEHH